jgi:hypothetical protein
MHVRTLCVSLLAVFLAAPVFAQTPPVSYDLIIYTPGSATAQTRNVLATAVQCNQPVPTTTNANPTTWFWSDPQFTGRLCKADDAARLTALPDGTYNGTVVPIDANGIRGVESASAPFTRLRAPLPPVAVTGVRLAR